METKQKKQGNKTNKDIIQSYVFTVAKYDANVYAKRILTHIVNANQDYVEGINFRGGVIINIEEDLFREREYTFNVKNILQGDEDKNHSRVIKAFHSLQNKFIRFDDEDDNHISVPFITSLIVKRKSGIAKFRMSELVHKAFSDFTKGYRKFEFELTLSFTSVYSIRLYELLSGQEKPYTVTIEDLKIMFGIGDKYVNKPTNFIKRVIEPAKKELDEKSPYSFEYKINKNGAKYHSITFYPVYQPQFRDENLETTALQKKVSPNWSLDKKIIDYLKQNFNFTTKEIQQHIELFNLAQSTLPRPIDFFAKIKTRVLKTGVENPQGYLINALNSELEAIRKKNETTQKTKPISDKVQLLTDKFRVK